MKSRSYFSILSILTLVFLLPGISDSRAENAPPDLNGIWVLDQEKSTDLAAMFDSHAHKMQGRGGGRGGGGGGMGGGGGRGGGGGGGGGRGGGMGQGGGGEQSKANAEAMAKRKEEMLQEFATVEIFQEGVELNITDGLEVTQLLYCDGRQTEVWTRQGQASASAHWEDSVLFVEWKTPRDKESRVRKFQLIENGKNLSVTEDRRVPGKDDAVSITLVYGRS